MRNEEIIRKDEYKESGLSQDSNSSNRYEYTENWTQNSTNKKNILDNNENKEFQEELDAIIEKSSLTITLHRYNYNYHCHYCCYY